MTDMFFRKRIDTNGILVLPILSLFIFNSCNYNVTDRPGPQTSSSIKSSKRNNVFICAYDVSGVRINGLGIESIFAEKKYWLEEGMLGSFKINYFESQIIIKFADDNTMKTLNGIAQNWDVINFRVLNSKLLVMYQQGITMPDTLAIVIRKDIKNPSKMDSLKFYKSASEK